MVSKYTYDNAVEVILEAFKNSKTITYTEMYQALGIDTSKNKSKHAIISAINKLRNIVREQYGLSFKSAATSNYNGPEYQYYTVFNDESTKLKNVNIKKKPVNELTNKTNSEELKLINALQKDNEKMYLEIEELREQNSILLNKYNELQESEEHYKRIIQSYQALNSILSNVN